MYELSVKAGQNFASIFDFTFLNHGELKADSSTNDLHEFLIVLADNPKMGGILQEVDDEIRLQLFEHHAILYRIRTHDIFIVRILHKMMLLELQ